MATPSNFDGKRNGIYRDSNDRQPHQQDTTGLSYESSISRQGRRIHARNDRTIEKINVTGERPHDSTEFNTGSWLEGRLLILDLAYFKFRRFARIDENGGYFVSRLKQNTKPEIVTERTA